MAGDVSVRMGAREWALLLVLSILWGGSFFFAKVAIAECRPSRSCSAGRVAAAALLIVRRPRPARCRRAGRLWLVFLVMGALNN